MENNNLQNIFDAIVGYNGSAAIDGWHTMSHADLVKNAHAQADEFYNGIFTWQADIIASAVIEYREAGNGNDGSHIREALA